jgi:hypothetical protein
MKALKKSVFALLLAVPMLAVAFPGEFYCTNWCNISYNTDGTMTIADCCGGTVTFIIR